ncbi:MAG TPA: hypothetical protein VNZ53_55585, partial [Steroidobacteraceae bacterium]|nr:hypothetical protein [Steroidobacteraceae bacterium]
MDGHVGRFHCRYRSMTNSPADAQFAARLNRVAKESLPGSLEIALDRALGEDPAVYILRSAKCDLFFNEDAQADDAQLASEWAEKIAFAVVRTIRGAEDGSNVVRFADRADQIASFIVDLLRGEAWASWFHDAFDHLRKHDFRTALSMALGESGRDLTAVLVFLRRRGFFEKVVSTLESTQLHLIWQKLHDGDALFLSRTSSAWRVSARDEGTLEGAFASAEPDQKRIPDEQLFDRETAEAEALRPLFMTALRLVELLDLCAGERPDTERLFRLWLASRPSPPRWVDRESLTAAVLDALRFLRQSIAARAIREEERAVVNRQLASWLANNSWLTQDQFAESAARLLFEPNVAMPLPDLPRRPADFLSTPRQRRLLEELRQALRGQSIRWGEPLESPANALRLLTLLVARFPQRSGDPLVIPFIERLLRELAGATGVVDIPELQTRAQPLPTTGGATLVIPAEVGRKAIVAHEVGAVHSACAGVFLLVRALLDLRMPALIASAEWAPLPVVLLG